MKLTGAGCCSLFEEKGDEYVAITLRYGRHFMEVRAGKNQCLSLRRTVEVGAVFRETEGTAFVGFGRIEVERQGEAAFGDFPRIVVAVGTEEATGFTVVTNNFEALKAAGFEVECLLHFGEQAAGEGVRQRFNSWLTLCTA